MSIRSAKKSDSKDVAKLIVQAMNDLAMKFTVSDNLKKAYPLFEHFFQLEANQYSFENTLVYEENGEICGSITGYDGAKLEQLRQPFLDYLSENFGYTDIPENETEAGEFYLDTVSVSPKHQGKGIGKQLIQAMIEHAKNKGFSNVGLLVDVDNPAAKKLYERIGFQVAGIKDLMGGKYEHMVFMEHSQGSEP